MSSRDQIDSSVLAATSEQRDSSTPSADPDLWATTNQLNQLESLIDELSEIDAPAQTGVSTYLESPYLEYLNTKYRFPRSLVHRPITTFFRSFLGQLSSGQRILDAGCGNGVETGSYAGQHEVHGVDYQDEYVAYCRKTYPQAQYRIGNLESLDYPDASFDTVVMNQVIEHLENPERVLAELKRILRPGGLLLVATPNYGTFVWPLVEATWHRWFAKGFDVEAAHVTPYNTGLLTDHLTAVGEVEVGTICLTSILVASVTK